MAQSLPQATAGEPAPPHDPARPGRVAALAGDGGPAAWILAPAGAPAEVWGMSAEERLRRALSRAGCRQVRTLEPDEVPASRAPGSVLVARADWVYDERLIEALVASPGTLLVAPGGGREPVAAHAAAERAAELVGALRGADGAALGLEPRLPGELAPAYTAKLRKSAPPYLLAARADLAREIEARTFSASYKGATDLVTKWVWPRPALAVTRGLARRRVHPNVVTAVSWVLAIACFWLFARGAFGLGLVAAWLMTFLDTVDGKLARVTLTSSRLGDVLDHGLDLVHPPFWWWAWGVGIGAAAAPATLVVVAGYFVGRILEGLFLAGFKIESHSWRPIDTLFRTITARRNPNLLLLTVAALCARPDLGMSLLAIWTLASLAFHAVQLLQALAWRRRGLAVEPWDRASRVPAI